MKITSLILGLLLTTATTAQARSPLSDGAFGLVRGVYKGTGTLISQTTSIPNMEYVSVRTIGTDTISAHTTASLSGVVVAQVSARLQIQPKLDGAFNLLDLDNNGQIVGSGSCDLKACSFKASILSGQLTLQETWVNTEAGFQIIDASQNAQGRAAKYEGLFQLVPEIQQ